MSDPELLTIIKQDPASFSILFELYYKSIFGYIFRRTGKVEDAADLAAETFVKAYNHINYFDYRGIALKTWLYRIATNETNLYFRHQLKKNTLFLRLDDHKHSMYHQYIQDDRMELELELQKHQQYLMVLEHLKRLPVKYQEVIALRYFEGKTNSEIADILDMNEGTLKSLLSRGLEKLREKCNDL